MPARCRAACTAKMQRFAKQPHLVMRKTSAARPGTQQANDQWRILVPLGFGATSLHLLKKRGFFFSLGLMGHPGIFSNIQY